MTISGYSANYFNDKDKKLYVATQILTTLLAKGKCVTTNDAVDVAISCTNRLMKKLEEEETND